MNTENVAPHTESSIEYYDRLIKEADDNGVLSMAVGARNMLLFDVSLNSVCCRLGENFHKTIELEKNSDKNALEIKKLQADENKLVEQRKAIYSGNEAVMYEVINANKG